MTWKTASTSWSSIEMKVVYYCRGSIIPALLAAATHRHAGTTPEEGLARAAAWLERMPPQISGAVCLFYDSAAGAAVYAASAAAPPELVEKTLASACALTGKNEKGRLIFAGVPRPGCLRRMETGPAGMLKRRHRLIGFWPEIAAAVEQVRLQLYLWKTGL